MILKEKLQMLMSRNSLNGQKLARLSCVSDSEISRILQGKSRPGLDNAFRLAKAVGVSLDYLADDTLDADPKEAQDSNAPEEQKILAASRKLGYLEVLTLLEIIRNLGYDLAINRLVGGKPVIEVEKNGVESRPAVPAQITPVVAPRAASASA
jgi:transcriptional regulator with XRE-family HTH domain